MTHLPKGAETLISMAFAVMFAEKIWRLLHLLLSLSLSGFTRLKGQAALGLPLGIAGGLRLEICCTMYNPAYNLQYHGLR
jgi:hypothetical protein